MNIIGILTLLGAAFLAVILIKIGIDTLNLTKKFQ